MAEVQAHGFIFEDWIVQEITGKTKNEYNLLIPNGYMSSYDIHKGILSDHNYSVKTTKKDQIECGDIIRQFDKDEYKMVVGYYDQVDEYKYFHSKYTFSFTSDHRDLLWGRMNREDLDLYVDYVKKIPAGKDGQLKFQRERKEMKKLFEDKNALFSINPKVDSKNQRRVQCSLKIKKLVKSIPYELETMNEYFVSQERTFNR